MDGDNKAGFRQAIIIHQVSWQLLPCFPAVALFAERSAGHRPGKLELEVAFEPGRCPAFQNMPLPVFPAVS
jgi:hypothetical protein